MGSSTRPDSTVLAGFGLTIAAAACFGATTVIARHVVTVYASPLTLSAFSLVFGTLFLLGLFHKDIKHSIYVPRIGLLFMVIAGLAAAAGPTLVFFALTYAPVTIVTPIASINPLMVILISYIFLRRSDPITFRLILGTILVIGGVTLIALGMD